MQKYDFGLHHVEIIDIRMEHPSDDSFGQVTSGFVRLRGPLTTAICRNSGREIELLMQKRTIWGLKMGFRPDEEESKGFSRNLHIMPLMTEAHPKFNIVHCLLLQPSGSSSGEFKRYGTIKYTDHSLSGGSNTQTPGPDAWRHADNHDWMEYEDFDGVSKYTISVI
jgi:hypothetical protein